MYTVEEKTHSSLSAMIAYAAAKAMREHRTVYVRRIGAPRALYQAVYTDRKVTVREV